MQSKQIEFRKQDVASLAQTYWETK